MPRHVLERVVALDETLGARDHLDRARLPRVVPRSVEVVIRGKELREDLGLLEVGERMEEDGQLVVVRVARLSKEFLSGSQGVSSRVSSGALPVRRHSTDVPQRTRTQEAHLHASSLKVPHVSGDGRHELDEQLLAKDGVWKLAREEQVRVDCGRER